MTLEADDFAISCDERVILARVPALSYSHTVASGVNR
jgi:hypothetical protein